VTFTLTMAVSPAGGGTTNPAVGPHTYAEGTVVPITATPNAGWQFDSWSGDPDCADGSVTMNADKTCTANFSPTGVIIDYAVTQLSPSSLSFVNPSHFWFQPAIYTVRVKNVGTASGPVTVTLSFTQVNPSCPAPFVFPKKYSLTLQPGQTATRVFGVLFFHCGSVSDGTTDYVATARVSAPGDSNTANDTKTGIVDVRNRHWWWW
jgi:hypothetical protein